MKVLITGGKGYIARNLKPLLEEAGYEVFAPPRTELDMLNGGDVLKAFEKVDVVIHAATRGAGRPGEDWSHVFVPNIQMFENILHADAHYPRTVFLLGSGAEYDLRYPINQAKERDIENTWPIDPYGLSKNLIARRRRRHPQMFLLRIFGCFNYDENPDRFIRRSIFNLRRGLPIQINQNKMMDYIYLEDLFRVIDAIIKVDRTFIPRDINMVYRDKVSLLDIASLIHKHTGIFDPVINLKELGEANPYTGDGYSLEEMTETVPNLTLLGLEEGIRRTALKLT